MLISDQRCASTRYPKKRKPQPSSSFLKDVMNKEDADAFPNAEILHSAWILFIARATSLGFLLQKRLRLQKEIPGLCILFAKFEATINGAKSFHKLDFKVCFG